MGQQATSGKQQQQPSPKEPGVGGSFFQGCRQIEDQEVETVDAIGVRPPRRGHSHDLDVFPYSNNHVGGPLRGPVSEVGSISGLSKSSRGSRGRDYHDDDAASVRSQRMRDEQNWIETENDKVAYLRRVQDRIGNRRGPGSDGGYSDATHDRHRGKSHRSGRHGGRGSDWDARSETQSDWSAPRSHRSGSSYRSRGSASSAYPASARGHSRPHDGHDRHGGDGYPDPYALRDRDHHGRHHDDRSHGSRGSYGGRRAEGMQIEPASRVPGLAVHREDMALMTTDLEAKLKSAQRKVEEVVEQSHRQEVRARQAENQLKEAETKTGGADMKYQLMGEIVNIRDRLLGAEKLRTETEMKAMQMEETLRNEETRREDAERTLHDLENEKNDLTSHVENLKAKESLLEEEKTKRNADQQKLERELQMIAKERDETLELLERAVKQKETLKRGKQDETQRAASELEKMRLEQQHDQHEVRELLKSVDHLLAKFNRSETRSSDASTAATNDLILIRDSVRKLVKANPDGGKKG